MSGWVGPHLLLLDANWKKDAEYSPGFRKGKPIVLVLALIVFHFIEQREFYLIENLER